MALCRSCGMKINGIPRLACYPTISELQDNGNNKTITCQPLSNFPHIRDLRDLVTDFSQFFSHHKNMVYWYISFKINCKSSL